MALGDKLKAFLKETEMELEYDPEFDKEEYEKEQEKIRLKEERAKEKEEGKNKTKVEKLYQALLKIKEKLENKKLTPFKRMRLQLKLDLIQTKLDKQLAKLDLKALKDLAEMKKDEIKEDLNRKLEEMEKGYSAILDKKYDVERDIDDMTYRIHEKQRSYDKINTISKEEGVYTYTISPELKNKIEQKQKELEVIENEEAAKEQEIINLKEQYRDRKDQITADTNKMLRKYNPVRLAFGSIAAFFERANRTIREWRSNRREEKEKVKEIKNRAKVVEKTLKKQEINKIREEKAGARINEGLHVIGNEKDNSQIELRDDFVQKIKQGVNPSAPSQEVFDEISRNVELNADKMQKEIEEEVKFAEISRNSDMNANKMEEDIKNEQSKNKKVTPNKTLLRIKQAIENHDDETLANITKNFTPGQKANVELMKKAIEKRMQNKEGKTPLKNRANTSTAKYGLAKMSIVKEHLDDPDKALEMVNKTIEENEKIIQRNKRIFQEYGIEEPIVHDDNDEELEK